MIQYTTMLSEDIQTDNQKYLERFKINPPHPSYISGFIDGDGCIFIRKITHGFQSGICLTQCRTNILQIIRYHFGGSITTSTNRNSKSTNIVNENNHYDKYNIRNQYNLLIRSNENLILIDYIQNNIVIKNGQMNCLNKFLQLINRQNKDEEKVVLYNICSDLNKHLLPCEIKFENINIAYIAGLFDAEGCFYICLKKFSKSYISITQKNNPIVLEYISELLGFGHIDCEKKFKIYKQTDCLKFIELVKTYLIVKYKQAEAFETFLKTTDITIKEQMYIICNKEKHEIELFSDLNKNENGKEGYFENLRLRTLKEQCCREIHLKHVYLEKSEKMKGEGNHNFGKSFSEETKKKMSISIREAKGGVSDEVILQVRQLISECKKNTEIQELLGLPKHTITRIKNGDIVCCNEEKKTKQSLTQIEINLSKRKIQTEEIIFVIEKMIEKWKPMQILDYLIEQRNKQNIANTLTIDIIKNIKRNLTNRKHVIYETEMSKEKYEYYLKIIKEFAEKLV
jgi:hypothetical protein